MRQCGLLLVTLSMQMKEPGLSSGSLLLPGMTALTVLRNWPQGDNRGRVTGSPPSCPGRISLSAACALGTMLLGKPDLGSYTWPARRVSSRCPGSEDVAGVEEEVGGFAGVEHLLSRKRDTRLDQGFHLPLFLDGAQQNCLLPEAGGGL
jgi:hypothetical protein